jgi:hypothetical protein
LKGVLPIADKPHLVSVLEQHFGPVVACNFSSSEGFGTICFQRQQAAENAVKASGTKFGGMALEIFRPDVLDLNTPSSTCIVLKNLSYTLSKVLLEELLVSHTPNPLLPSPLCFISTCLGAVLPSFLFLAPSPLLTPSLSLSLFLAPFPFPTGNPSCRPTCCGNALRLGEEVPWGRVRSV